MPLSTGTNIILRSGQDPDALAYFSRAGIASGTQTPSSYDNAASFNGTNQFLSNSSFAQSGSFTLSFWVNTSPPGLIGVINKGLATSNVSDWSLYKTGTSLCFAGSSAGQQSPAVATISLNQWNFVVVTYDATSLVKSIQVNNGTVSSNAGTTAFSNTYSQINLSCLNGSYFSGSMAGVGYWNRVLSASEVTALFNNGAGRTYASLDSGLRNNLVSWWALNGTSSAVSLTDSHGVVTGTPNNLTNNGTVTAPNIGPIITGYSDSRRLISDFVRGIKSLGLWNSMVCWPLRASQNASTTLTARSLGGLGTFDGTIAGVSASNWLSNGLNLPNNTGFVSFPSMADFSSGITAGSVHSINSLASPNRGLSFEGLSPIQQGGLWSTFSDGHIYWDCMTDGFGRLSIASGAAANTYYMWSGSSNGTSIYLNASRLATGGVLSGLSNTFNIQFGRTQTTLAFNGNVSFIYILRSGLTNAQIASFYSFYRSTIGIGLALP
jgi:hypothetical protein